MATHLQSRFSRLLKHWRTVRRLSQLDLALQLSTSARHLSFLETGRSRPSTDMVGRLCESLRLPLRERNVLFEAAGLPTPYADNDLEHADLEPFRRVLDRLLEGHEPYPALVVDRLYRVVRVNIPAGRMFQLSDGPPLNLLDLFLSPETGRNWVENWQQVAWTTLQRLRAQLAADPDPDLAQLVTRCEGYLEGVPPPRDHGVSPVVCPILRVGEQRIHTLTAVARFNATHEVKADELRVELIYPADDEADAFFRQLAGPPTWRIGN